MKLSVRVYYEDTDAGGVVYYANYLRFLERGRSELLRAAGFSQQHLAQTSGIAFAVRELTVDYRRPARLDDWLDVHTAIEVLGRAQVTFAQRILRGEDLLLTARVRVACLDLARGRPVALPAAIAHALSQVS